MCYVLISGQKSVTGGLQEPNLVFPLGASVQCSHSVFTATLQNVTTVNNENHLYIWGLEKVGLQLLVYETLYHCIITY